MSRLRIKEIQYRYTDTSDGYESADGLTVFDVGREIKFKVRVENIGNDDSPEYTVSVYDDEDGDRLDHDSEPSIEPGEINSAYLYVTINTSGKRRLGFEIKRDDDSDYTYESIPFIWVTESQLEIKNILYRYAGTSNDYKKAEEGTVFEEGREVRFKVNVINNGDMPSTDYTVYIYDKDGLDVDFDDENSLEPGESNHAFLNVTMDSGKHDLIFQIKVDYKELDSVTRTYIWGEEAELSITDIEYRYHDSDSVEYYPANSGTVFDEGREVKFRVEVKNISNMDSSEYTGFLYDENGNQLDSDDGRALEADDSNHVYFYITMDSSTHDLTFKVEMDGDVQDSETRTFIWGEKDDDGDVSPIIDRKYYINQGDTNLGFDKLKIGNSNQTVKESGCYICAIGTIVCWDLKDSSDSTKIAIIKHLGSLCDNDANFNTTKFTYANKTFRITKRTTNVEEYMKNKLEDGIPTICHLSGHFIVINGDTSDNEAWEKFLVLDPGRRNNDTLDDVMGKYGQSLLDARYVYEE